MASTKELVRMQLGYYKPAACLELGKVTIGHQTTADLVLENDEDVEVLVLVTKISNKFKQDIKVDKLEIVVEPHSEEKLTFSWTPTSAGIVSESVAFDLNDGRCRMQCKIVGEAIEPPKPKVQRRPTANRENQKWSIQGKSNSRAGIRAPLGVVQTVIEEPKLSISSSKPEVDEFPVAGVAWNRTGSLPILNETGHQPAASDSPRRSTFVVKNSMPSTRIDHFKVPLKPNPESSPRRETFIVAKVKGNKSTTNHDGEPKKLTGPKTITEELVANDNAHHVESKFKEVANVSISQQEYCLTVWLNYIFKPQFLQTPDTGANVLRLFQQVVTDKGTSMTERISGTKSQQLSYQRYTEIHSYHQLRLKAKNLFDDLILVMEKVDKTIIEKKIIIRPDCKVYADVGKKNKLVQILFSINYIWLRLGLETIYAEALPMGDSEDWKELLLFINQRLLNDPKIRQKYAYPGVVSLFRDGYNDAISQHILRNFVKLVVFLDRAAATRLIPYQSCLFRKKSEWKSTKALLGVFASEFLSGEGDIFRHLKYISFTAQYQQIWLDEFDYTVTNMAGDFKDGIRLSKLVETISHKDLSGNLLNPLGGRIPKIHNVTAALEALKTAEISSLELDPRHIVDGHQENTIELLWQLVEYQQVISLVKLLPPDFNGEELQTALLSLCRRICLIFNEKVSRFTFDPKILCCLVSFYASWLIPSRILMRMRKTGGSQEDYLQLFKSSIQQIGGVPILFEGIGDTTLTDSKVVGFFFKVLFHRLLLISRDFKAARSLQKAWRARKQRSQLVGL